MDLISYLVEKEIYFIFVYRIKMDFLTALVDRLKAPELHVSATELLHSTFTGK